MKSNKVQRINWDVHQHITRRNPLHGYKLQMQTHDFLKNKFPMSIEFTNYICFTSESLHLICCKRVTFQTNMTEVINLSSRLHFANNKKTISTWNFFCVLMFIMLSFNCRIIIETALHTFTMYTRNNRANNL